MPSFIQALIDAGKNDPGVGSVCGKLLAMSPDFHIESRPRVDSTGIYFTPNLRHLDRGSREIDNGHYLKREYVFGATAAAALYRRDMIDDLSINGEFFDPFTAKMPMSPGALNCSAGAASTRRMRAATTSAPCCPATAGRCLARSTCTRSRTGF
jgi:hypothetical protein